MTDFIGTVVVLAIGVAVGIMLAYTIFYHLVESELGSKMIKHMCNRIMEISLEWTRENGKKLTKDFTELAAELDSTDE